MTLVRQTYVISDLHLGGVYGKPDVTEDRGFRLCTHVPELTKFVNELVGRPNSEPSIELVINGDLVDFLAESEGEPPQWRPFLADDAAAAARFDEIVKRDASFFAALAGFLKRGHRLVLLLGNHDIELSLPAVRRRLQNVLEVSGKEDFQFIYDGEAYVVGDALIEHGNRYDEWNMVDNEALRRLRSLQSRRQLVPGRYEFCPPAGSRLMSSVMNPVKTDYRFVDLLKPETDAVLPILLALEPGYRSRISEIIPLGGAARRHRLAFAALPGLPGDISSEEEVEEMGTEMVATDDASLRARVPRDAVERALQHTLGPQTADFLTRIDDDCASEDFVEEISSAATVVRTWGLMRLLISRDRTRLKRRLPALLRALQVLQDDRTFNRSVETLPEYQNAAEELARGGFRWILFGHTHLARDVALSSGAHYINTGTWADLIRFPKEIVSGSETQALAALEAFVWDLAEGRLAKWISFVPTYCRLDFNENDRDAAEHCDHSRHEPRTDDLDDRAAGRRSDGWKDIGDGRRRSFGRVGMTGGDREPGNPDDSEHPDIIPMKAITGANGIPAANPR